MSKRYLWRQQGLTKVNQSYAYLGRALAVLMRGFTVYTQHKIGLTLEKCSGF
jgi:hypothetical protein